MVIKNTHILYFESAHPLFDGEWTRVYETEIDGECYYFSESDKGTLHKLSSNSFKIALENTKKLLQK